METRLTDRIRDHWDKDSASVHAARKHLEKVLGLQVRIDPEWPQLLHALDALYDDRQNLIVAVVQCVELFCKVLADLVDNSDDDQNETWAETLMERVKSAVLRVFVATSDTENGRESGVSWNNETAGFVLTLPRKEAVVVATEFAPLYRQGILHCFDEKVSKGEPGKKAEGAEEGDEWADVAVDKSGKPSVLPGFGGTAAGTRQKVVYLPTAASLPSPDELLLRPPYYLSVLNFNSQRVEITSSHSPSLEIISEYLKRWCRSNYNSTEKPPGVEVKLYQSPWATGPYFDRVVLTTENTRYTTAFALNPMVVLNLVESVLGYDLLSYDGGVYTYRRDVVFKK